MAESGWSTLYDEAKSGVVAGIPEGTYDVEVADVRSLATSRLLFLDIRVLNGPLAGRIAQVNLYLPKTSVELNGAPAEEINKARGARAFFSKKIVGFGDLAETFKQMDSAQDVAAALDILADALTGRKVSADIELRSDGEYAGTNQLTKTKPVDDVPATVTAAPPETVTVAPPATVTVQPEPAMSGEVPF